MVDSLSGWLPLAPVPGCQLRATRSGRTYTPKRQAVAKRALTAYALHGRPDEPLSGPLSLRVVFWFAAPRSWSRKKAAAAIAGDLRPASRSAGDVDNLCKLLQDALQAAGYMEDDAQIVDLVASKRYGPDAGYEFTLARSAAPRPPTPGRPPPLPGGRLRPGSEP